MHETDIQEIIQKLGRKLLRKYWKRTKSLEKNLLPQFLQGVRSEERLNEERKPIGLYLPSRARNNDSLKNLDFFARENKRKK